MGAAVPPSALPRALPPASGLVAGVGAGRGVAAAAVVGLVRSALADAGLSPHALGGLASVDAKAGEPGLVEAARVLGVELLTFSADALAAVPVPNPSAAALAAVGTPSVAEAAAVLGAGGGELLVRKRSSAPGGPGPRCTVAVARRPHDQPTAPGPGGTARVR